MSLNPETVERIQSAYAEDFGEELSAEEAHQVSANLVGLFEKLIELNKKYSVVNLQNDDE
jgi:hypothetical protein